MKAAAPTLLFVALALSATEDRTVPELYHGRVPLCRLLAVPERYINSKVTVSGIMYTDGKDAALFLDGESRSFFVSEHALWLNLSAIKGDELEAIRKSDGKWARIKGIFDPREFGKYSLYAGSVSVETFSVKKKILPDGPAK